MKVRPFWTMLVAGGLFLILAAGCSFAQDISGFPRSVLDEMNRYPDLTQTDVRAGLPWGGWLHCGPVAVSNGLIWLRERGVGVGPASSGDPWADQVEMARRLGSSRYMDTGFFAHGTTVAGFLEGLEGYLQDHSRESFSIKYMGWAVHGERFSTGLKTPDLRRICGAFAGGSPVFLDLGWYRFRRGAGQYRRNGGHWVTFVGYDWPEKQADPTLYVHDPAPWSGKAGKAHPVRLARAGTALFTDRSGTAIGSLAPYRCIAGGLSVKKGTEMTLLEGAVILSPEIEPSVPWTEAARRHESPHFPWQLISGGDGP